jgi:hypothetical protein
MNKVYSSKEATKEMTIEELKKVVGFWVDIEYIKGILERNHCECKGNGEFVLLPEDDPAVVEGGKRYMVCKKCNYHSHL